MGFDEVSVVVKIEAVLNTLPLLEMPPTFDNTNRMLGIYNALQSIRADLKRQEKEPGVETAGKEEVTE